MTSKTLDSEGLNYLGDKLIWQDIDRWIFVFMAALLFVTVLSGFIPSSIGKISAVQSGQRPPFLPVLHVHAILMGTWILLLLTQSSLMASKHGSIHKKLGLASIVLAPAMVITGVLVAQASFGQIWALDPSQVPDNVIDGIKARVSNVALLQMRFVILFPIIIALALYFRKTDPETHKRLMILATAIPLGAGIARITWLPHTMPDSPDSVNLYILLLISPLFIYDLLRHKKVPRAYMFWAAGFFPSTVVMHILWSSPWWMSTVPMLMGVESW